MADEYLNRFLQAVMSEGMDPNAAKAAAQILATFRVVSRARPGHTLTETDSDAIIVFPRLFTYDLPNNPFWQRHAATLGPQLQLAVMDWIESAMHAPGGSPEGLDPAKRKGWVEAKQREVSTRSTIYSFVTQMVYLGGGDATGVREALASAMVEE